ncbi:hypothetical protein Xbed_03720 [Xenorhabdus beddingii]|uniref:Uncharacterized protein n=1 Tax=Xenorhabdus beddingii TaxID=40578 RepID=A0A1Y2S9N9_9GAMM|nr:hypothetical protein [Xenorhabdus beddingii]OTA14209.1 hypothetical protein Xbed_03720 [Xenorhabdus beddingii]
MKYKFEEVSTEKNGVKIGDEHIYALDAAIVSLVNTLHKHNPKLSEEFLLQMDYQYSLNKKDREIVANDIASLASLIYSILKKPD